MTVLNLLQRISEELTRLDALAESSVPLAPSEQPVHAGLRDCLSGAFGCKVMVKEGVSGGVFALVPAPALKSSGLTVQRSIIPGIAPVLSGEYGAISNAERRVSKRLGEGWSANLASYEPYHALVVFELHAPETT